MIPLSFNYLWIFFVAGFGTIIFSLFAIGLIFSSKFRNTLRHGNIFIQSLFVCSVLCVFLSLILYFLVLYTKNEIEKEHHSIHKTLSSPEKILGIQMPQGTELELFAPDQLTSLRQAKFPQPVLFGKLQINSMKIPRGIDLELFDDRSTTLMGTGKDTIEGWNCQLMSYIQVYLDDAGNIIGLEHCNLAQDTQLENIILVAQADIERSKYQKYPDNFVSTDYWRIHNPLTQYKAVSLQWANVYLDQNKQLIGIENGILTEKLTLGDIQYPANTEFNLLVHPLTQNETWLFTPPNDQNAIARNGKVYTHDQTIIQRPNGKIEQILNSNDPRILARRMNH